MQPENLSAMSAEERANLFFELCVYLVDNAEHRAAIEKLTKLGDEGRVLSEMTSIFADVQEDFDPDAYDEDEEEDDEEEADEETD